MIEDFQCIKEIKTNGVIAYPTDTLWGLGASAMSSDAVNRIYELKERQHTLPVSILVSDIAMASDYAVVDDSLELMKLFLPGPVTFILPSKHKLKTPPKETVGIRISTHPFVEIMFKHLDIPIITTSINKTGSSPAVSREDLEWLPSDVVIADWQGGEVVGIPSTVVEVKDKNIKIYREGYMSHKAVESIAKPLGYKIF